MSTKATTICSSCCLAGHAAADCPDRMPFRRDDWNRVEREWDAGGAVCELTEEAARSARPLGASGRLEAECPLCRMSFDTHHLFRHVGSTECERNLLDLAILDAIGV